MGRSWTMLRFGPRHVKVRNGFDTDGVSATVGTARIASFTCAQTTVSRRFWGA